MSRAGWSTSLSEARTRRGLLRGAAGLLALGAGGCGFRPLYGEGGAAAADPAIAPDLASVSVPVIPERFGQLLRRDLQARLRNGGATNARWELLVGPSFQADSIGIQPDGNATRVRYIATANWTLVRIQPRETIANGFERAYDAFNVQPNQYFASDSANDATQRRLSQQLAEEIVTRLASRFRTLQDGTPARLIEPVPTPPMPSQTPAGVGIGPSAPSDSPGLGGGLSGGIGGTGPR